MTNPRIEKLKESIHVDKYPMCVEKGRLITESYRQTEGEPEIIRRAKALAHVLDHITIFIEDGQLIVGNGASKPMGVEIDYYYSTWSEEEIQGLEAGGLGYFREGHRRRDIDERVLEKPQHHQSNGRPLR